ncbi:glutamate-cysteine ligase family protein [Nocardia farcinica]|uniref:glutamate-cysteine ligase family protein n=1 Tax=Nocardia farcinica TaxID=37329 RepID=UPI002A1E72CA|nr:glutamate--cysteine ligase [Nocardia farcinica]
MPSPKRTLLLEHALDLSRSMFSATGEDLIGLECEWLVRDWREPQQRPRPAALESVAESPLPGGGRITLEPGGQLELSSFPAVAVSRAIDQVNHDEQVIHSRLLGLGLNFEIRAVERCRPPQRILRRPRYASMEAYFDARNPVGRWMMCNTASLQVNVSNDACDPLHRWYVLNRVAPALVTMFANSRGTDASGQTWASLRQGIWMSMDPGRTAPVTLDLVPEEAWLGYALLADVMYVPDPDDCTRGIGLAPGMSFGAWMRDGSDFGYPTIDDLRYHFSTLFPPVRPRGWLELRVLDALPSWMRTAAALTVATIVQREVSAEICATIRDLSDRHIAAARDGFADPIIATAVRELSRIVLENVHRVTDRAEHLDALFTFVARYTSQGISPGDEAVQRLPVHLTGAHGAAVS